MAHESDRHAVEYYWPGTLAGDGRPVTGVAFIDAESPIAAWDEHERRLRSGERELDPTQEIVLRACRADDLRDLTPLRFVIDREGLR